MLPNFLCSSTTPCSYHQNTLTFKSLLHWMSHNDLLIIFRVSYHIGGGSKHEGGVQPQQQHRANKLSEQIHVDCNQYWILIPPACKSDHSNHAGSMNPDHFHGDTGSDADSGGRGNSDVDDSFMVLMKLVDRDDLFIEQDDMTTSNHTNTNNYLDNNSSSSSIKEALSVDDLDVMQEIAEFFDQSLMRRVQRSSNSNGNDSGTSSAYDPMTCPSNTINALVRNTHTVSVSNHITTY